MSFTIQEAPEGDHNEPRVLLSNIDEQKLYLGFIDAPPEHDDDYELIPDLSAGHHHIQDFFTLENNQNPDSISCNNDLRENIFAILKLTSEKEKEIILNLYGLNEKCLELGELSELYGITVPKVKELQTKALKKMKKAFIEYNLI